MCSEGLWILDKMYHGLSQVSSIQPPLPVLTWRVAFGAVRAVGRLAVFGSKKAKGASLRQSQTCRKGVAGNRQAGC